MSGQGWGSNWGSIPWGSGFGTPSLGPVWPISERQVWVTFNNPPVSVSPIAAGDVLNPASWSIQKLDDSQNLIVLGVGVVDVNRVELYTLYKFGAWQIRHGLTFTYVDTGGSTTVFTSNFAGARFVAQAEVKHGLVDIANPFFPESGVDGAIQVTSGGDYAKESGVALLRKLVIRRLTSMPGDFFYMTVDEYGLGLKVKEIPSIGEIGALRSLIIAQLQQEPEFETIDCKLSITGDGVMMIHLKCLLALTNEQIPIDIPATSAIQF